LAAPSAAQQSVFLDFDSGTDGNIDYTTSMRNSIQSLMEDVYQQFNVSFLQAAPTTGPFSTLTFNSGVAGGLADDIDFRNLNNSDNAVINVEGLGFTETEEIIGLSANIASHEFGHLMGLRHRDSFGPIGSGVINGVSGSFLPAFAGPTNASEFGDHVMSTPALGASVERFASPVWLSERSAIKIAMSENGTTDNEVATANDSIATAQNIVLASLEVPNTILAGQNSSEIFDVEAIAVIGSISSGDSDFFSFEGEIGDLLNFEVISSATNRLTSFDTQVSLFDANGDFVDYYGEDAFNDDEIEGLDSVLIDVILPTTGTYFVQINGFNAAAVGDYELFISNFGIAAAVPEPSSMALLAIVGLAVCGNRRRKIS
jgi:hypothetical protein